jgi:hypothetical protein
MKKHEGLPGEHKLEYKLSKTVLMRSKPTCNWTVIASRDFYSHFLGIFKKFRESEKLFE